jgi:hypothetical protein
MSLVCTLNELPLFAHVYLLFVLEQNETHILLIESGWCQLNHEMCLKYVKFSKPKKDITLMIKFMLFLSNFSILFVLKHY